MAKADYKRRLSDFVLMEEFIKKILVPYAADNDPDALETIIDGSNPDRIKNDLVRDVVGCEILIERYYAKPTETYVDYRDADYRSDIMRDRLRHQIVKELYEQCRLSCDDDIRLGHGGAKPNDIQSNAEAYIVTGPPASGKSGIAECLANKHGAYMLDSDYAKRKLPEYNMPGGATLVHREADGIVFNPEKSLLEYCVYNRHNIVIPIVGKTLASVEQIIALLREAKYSVHIVDVVLDRQICTLRALQRYRQTKRYVPLSYVFDEVGNEPDRVYFLLKRKYWSDDHDSPIVSFMQLSTLVAKGEKPTLLEHASR